MLEYQLPSGCVPLSAVFSQLETRKETLNIEDYSVSLTTLDRVRIIFRCQSDWSHDQSATTTSKKKANQLLYLCNSILMH